MCRSVLDASKCLVDLEHLTHVLPKLRTHIILGQTANEGRMNALAGADGGEKACSGVPNACEGGICLQEARDDLGSFRLQLVATQAAKGVRQGRQRALTAGRGAACQREVGLTLAF